MDLVKEFDQAKDKRPSAASFSLVDVTINGETKRAIFTQPAPQTRIIWHFTVPDDAWFTASLGLKPEAWTMGGDGVLFLVGVSDNNGHFEQLLNVPINPAGNPSDRIWHNVTVDLSPYAGQTVDLICNTYSGTPGHDDRTGDLAVWGSPRIVVH